MFDVKRKRNPDVNRRRTSDWIVNKHNDDHLKPPDFKLERVLDATRKAGYIGEVDVVAVVVVVGGAVTAHVTLTERVGRAEKKRSCKLSKSF